MIQQGVLLMILLLIGGTLGLLYFGGLWVTLRHLPKTEKPILLFSWSYMIRLGAVLGIFHLILQWTPPEKQLPLLLISFLGFLVVRTWLITHLALTSH